MMVNLKHRGALCSAPTPCRRGRASRGSKKTGGPARAPPICWRRPRGVAEDAAEARRVAFLEPLDELEEYRLIQKHYVVSWGVLGTHRSSDESENESEPPESDATRLERSWTGAGTRRGRLGRLGRLLERLGCLGQPTVRTRLRDYYR